MVVSDEVHALLLEKYDQTVQIGVDLVSNAKKIWTESLQRYTEALENFQNERASWIQQRTELEQQVTFSRNAELGMAKIVRQNVAANQAQYAKHRAVLNNINNAVKCVHCELKDDKNRCVCMNCRTLSVCPPCMDRMEKKMCPFCKIDWNQDGVDFLIVKNPLAGISFQ